MFASTSGTPGSAASTALAMPASRVMIPVTAWGTAVLSWQPGVRRQVVRVARRSFEPRLRVTAATCPRCADRNAVAAASCEEVYGSCSQDAGAPPAVKAQLVRKLLVVSPGHP